MNLRQSLALVCLGLLVICRCSRGADGAASDPVMERLFPPELILHNGEAIGLSDSTREIIHSRVEKAHARFEQLERALRKEQETMAALVDQPKVDEAEALKQLDKLVASEREIRREQLSLLIALRNSLTPDQQSQLKVLRKTYKPAVIEAKLKDKVALVESAMQEYAAKGRDASAIAERMQQFPELMRVGKVKEAEALLDRVLNELEAK